MKLHQLAPFPHLVSYLSWCSGTIGRLILMRVTNEGGSVSEEECVIVHRVVVRQSKEAPFFIKGSRNLPFILFSIFFLSPSYLLVGLANNHPSSLHHLLALFVASTIIHHLFLRFSWPAHLIYQQRTIALSLFVSINRQVLTRYYNIFPASSYRHHASLLGAMGPEMGLLILTHSLI